MDLNINRNVKNIKLRYFGVIMFFFFALSACSSTYQKNIDDENKNNSARDIIDKFSENDSKYSSEEITTVNRFKDESKSNEVSKDIELKEVNEFMIKQYNQAAEAAQDALWREFWDEGRKYLRREVPHTNADTGNDYWWFAHAIDVLVDGYERTGDKEYLKRADLVARGVYERNGNSFINDYFDDMDWMALALIRYYDNTSDEFYLDQSKILFREVSEAWSGIAGGGVAWRRKSLNFKNTPSNAPAVILAVRLFERTKEQNYADWAYKIFTWLHNNLRDSETGYIIDGLRDANELIVEGSAYTYNHGTYIGAASEMYRLTGDKKYLEYAEFTLENATEQYSNNSAKVIDETGEGDGGLFKGILIRYANVYYYTNPEKSTWVKEWITINTDSVIERSVNKLGLISDNWRGPASRSQHLSSHLSGVMLLEACCKQYNEKFANFNYTLIEGTR